MCDLFDLGQEREPGLFGNDTPKDTPGVRDDNLSCAKLDEELLNQFERRVGLDRDGCLCVLVGAGYALERL